LSPIVNYPAGGLMFIDPDLRAMVVARFELVGTEETPGVPDTPAGLAAARSSALRELVRLIYDRSKFSPAAFAGERSSLALVVERRRGPLAAHARRGVGLPGTADRR